MVVVQITIRDGDGDGQMSAAVDTLVRKDFNKLEIALGRTLTDMIAQFLQKELEGRMVKDSGDEEGDG